MTRDQSIQVYFFVTSLLIPLLSFSQSITWVGGTDNDWHKSCNWNTSVLPTCSDDVVIPTAKFPDVTGIAHCNTIEIQGTSVIDVIGSGIIEVSDAGSCVGTATNNTGGGTPTATAASAIGNTGFTANWNAVGGATTYYLDVSTVSNFASFVTGYSNKNVGNVTSSAVTGLNCTTTYYYRLRAGNACGSGANSNTINLTTTGTLPAAPVATAATNIMRGNFRANWNTVVGATGYYVQIDGGAPIYVAGGATNFYSDCVNCGGGSHSYTIQAANPCIGPSSNTINWTAGACFPCDPPKNPCEYDPCFGWTLCACDGCACP